MATQDDYIRTALRVPPGLHAQIHEHAKSNNRTFNAEIVARLQASFPAQATTAQVGLQITGPIIRQNKDGTTQELSLEEFARALAAEMKK